MAYVYYADDGSIQGFSREPSDIPLGTHCTAISQEDFEILSAIPTGFKVDPESRAIKAQTVADREDWILWIPVVLNHRYIDGEFIPLVREPTPFEEWVRASHKGIQRQPESKE